MAHGASEHGLVGIGPSSTNARERREQLRSLVSRDKPLLMPGVTDAMGARLVERAGFEAVYVSGAGIANAQFGMPDIGLISLTEIVEQASRITNATDLPVVVDADTGFGAPLSAMRTLRRLEQSGVAGIQLEDQQMPKRCGHFDSHRLVTTEEMQAKISAMREAREDDALLLIARTDARSAYDLDEAVRRARAYVAAGADVIFVEALRTRDELQQVGQDLAGVPLVVNVVEGGKTPQLSLQDYEDLGYDVVLYANFLLRAFLWAGERALAHLEEHGDSVGYVDRILTWERRQEFFNLAPFDEAEERFAGCWRSVPTA